MSNEQIKSVEKFLEKNLHRIKILTPHNPLETPQKIPSCPMCDKPIPLEQLAVLESEKCCRSCRDKYTVIDRDNSNVLEVKI